MVPGGTGCHLSFAKPYLKIGSANKAFFFGIDNDLNFFWNKTFLFFKIESWNFQHLFEINLTKFQLYLFLSCCQYQNKKALVTDPIFSEGFGRLDLLNSKKQQNNFKCILSRDLERVVWAAVALRIKILINLGYIF